MTFLDRSRISSFRLLLVDFFVNDESRRVVVGGNAVMGFYYMTSVECHLVSPIPTLRGGVIFIANDTFRVKEDGEMDWHMFHTSGIFLVIRMPVYKAVARGMVK